MASKSNKMNRTLFILALLGLVAGALIRLYFHGLEENSVEYQNHNGANLVATILLGIYDVSITLGNKIHNALITLTIKFLHFIVAKSLKYRYSSCLQPAESAKSMLFWVAFTQAISSMSDN